MSRQHQQIVIFFLLALMSYAVWNYYFNNEIQIKDKPFTKGYSVKNLELKIIDDSGFLTAKFISPNLIRYTDSPVVFMDDPQLWTYKEGVQQWLMISDKAEYNTSLNEVGLYNNLVAHTVNVESETTIKANNLLLDLNSKHAQTDDGIVFQQTENYRMTGQIAQFDLNNEILEVNNDVKAVYKAPK